MASIAAAGLAAGLPFLLEKLFPGKKERMEQAPAMAPGQIDLLSQLTQGLTGSGFGQGPMGAGMQSLSDMLSGKPEAFAQFEAPYKRQFAEETVPQLAELFSGIGAGAQRSSAFPQALGAAGAKLSENLAMLHGGLRQQGLSQLMSMLGMGLGARPFESIFRPATGGMGKAMAPGLGMGLGMGLPSAMSQMGSGISSLFDLFKNKRPMAGYMSSPGYNYQMLAD